MQKARKTINNHTRFYLIYCFIILNHYNYYNNSHYFVLNIIVFNIIINIHKKKIYQEYSIFVRVSVFTYHLYGRVSMIIDILHIAHTKHVWPSPQHSQHLWIWLSLVNLDLKLTSRDHVWRRVKKDWDFWQE